MGNTIFRSIFMIWLPVAVIALFVVRARKKGFADMSYNLMIERKTLNAGGQAYQPTPEEAEHCFKPSKGFLIGFVSFAPPVLFALLALLFSGVPSAFAVFDPICRILLNPYLLLFEMCIRDSKRPWSAAVRPAGSPCGAAAHRHKPPKSWRQYWS